MSTSEAPDGIDLDRIARAVREILIAVGEDPDRDGLVKTPGRVARMYEEIFAGLREDPAQPGIPPATRVVMLHPEQQDQKEKID